MQKLLFTIAFCILAGFSAQAQTQQKAGQSIFFELAGPGIASLNYDTRFTKSNGGIGGRIGLGGYSIDGDKIFTVPIGINYLLSKDNKHFFELGGGFTYLNRSDEYYVNSNGQRVYYNYDNDEPFESSFGHLTFGYRLQPAEGGFQFRAAATPIFGPFGFNPLYFSLSFGYKF